MSYSSKTGSMVANPSLRNASLRNATSHSASIATNMNTLQSTAQTTYAVATAKPLGTQARAAQKDNEEPTGVLHIRSLAQTAQRGLKSVQSEYKSTSQPNRPTSHALPDSRKERTPRNLGKKSNIHQPSHSTPVLQGVPQGLRLAQPKI